MLSCMPTHGHLAGSSSDTPSMMINMGHGLWIIAYITNCNYRSMHSNYGCSIAAAPDIASRAPDPRQTQAEVCAASRNALSHYTHAARLAITQQANPARRTRQANAHHPPRPAACQMGSEGETAGIVMAPKVPLDGRLCLRSPLPCLPLVLVPLNGPLESPPSPAEPYPLRLRAR